MSSEESPVASPEDVACYEECVTDEIFIPLTNSSPHSQTVRPSHGVPKVNAGKITKKVRSRPKSLKQRKCSSPLVLQWLEENYEMVAGSCLPRSVLYTHYQDFCKKSQMEPSSAASFGKIIRLKFPNLSTRRLGTRGQSKYHYYGLAIKETSVYYRSVYSKKGLTRFSGTTNKRENGQMYNPNSKTGILLPEFPKVSELQFAKPFPVSKVETFLIMYKAHCQRILDSVVRANFHEVQDFLIHFWQGMPTHMLPILGCQATVDLVVVCDFVLYRTLCEVLIPASLQSLPDNLMEEIVTFSHNVVEWVFNALQDLPAALGIRKVQTCEMFGKSLRRQTALVQLARGVRAMLRNSEEVASLLQDWRRVDTDSMVLEAQQSGSSCGEDLFRELIQELEQLFVKQSSLEVYFEWLDSVIEKRVSEPCEKGLSLVELSQDFMVCWNNFYTYLEKQFTAMNAKSFDHYCSLHLLLDEYINYVIELLQAQAIETQYNEVLKVQRSSNQPSPINSTEQPSHCQIFTGEDDLRPVFPPTPDPTPLTSDREFFIPFDSKLTNEFANQNPNYFLSDLHSPFAPVSESFCDSFIKAEFTGYVSKSCSMTVPTLSQDPPPITPFLDSTPLTPQSSNCSSSSPFSHVSMPSPEPFPAELDKLSHSTSVSPSGSPVNFNNGDTSQYESCPPPPTQASASGLDIVHSLELISGPGHSNVPVDASYVTMPPLEHITPTSTCNPPSTHNGYAHYEYELLQLMSNPDDLLTDPKSLLHTSAPPTQIH